MCLLRPTHWYDHLLTLFVQRIKNQDIEKWPQFERICAIYFEDIVTYTFLRSALFLKRKCCPTYMYVQYTKKSASKKWLPCMIICALYLEYIVPSNFVLLSPILLTVYFQYTKNQAVQKWPPFEFICALYLEHIVTYKFVRT